MSEILREGNRTTVKPGEDIAGSSVPAFRSEIDSLLEEGPNELVIDLTDVEMIDSEGVSVLMWTHSSLEKAGGRLIVINADRYIYYAFETFGLDRLFTVQRRA